MCVSPVSIPNPYFGQAHIGYNYFHDCTSARIEVGCGHCFECIAIKQMSLVQRIQMEAYDNVFFMATLTYSNEMLPTWQVSTGYTFPFADYRDLNLLIKRLRKHNFLGRPFRYFAVSELGSKKARPHFHILFIVPIYIGDTFSTYIDLEQRYYSVLLNEWTVNVGSTRKPEYKNLCNYVRYYTRNGMRSNFDFHYIQPKASANGVADCAFYVLKYMLKPSSKEVKRQQALKINLPEDEYNLVYNNIKSRYFDSLYFGNPNSEKVKKHIRQGIVNYRDLYPYPVYVNPDSGLTFPLCRYYKNRFFTFDDAQYQYLQWETGSIDGYFEKKRKDHNLLKSQIEQFNRKVQQVYSRDDFTDYLDDNENDNPITQLPDYGDLRFEPNFSKYSNDFDNLIY